jgi:hypothetical protein
MVPLGIFLEDTHLRSYPMLFAVNSGGRAWHHHRELPFRYCVTCFVPVADRVRDVVEIASGDFARDCSVEISASVRVAGSTCRQAGGLPQMWDAARVSLFASVVRLIPSSETALQAVCGTGYILQSFAVWLRRGSVWLRAGPSGALRGRLPSRSSAQRRGDQSAT